MDPLLATLGVVVLGGFGSLIHACFMASDKIDRWIQ